MRYIEKHFDAANVVQHEDELEKVHLDEASLVAKKQIENLNGKELYKQIRSTEFIPHWRSLQDQLNIDQGGVCCYCGAKLYYPDSQHYSVEHVSPRTSNPELVGEYKNLLLSCHSSEEERSEIKRTVTRRKDRKYNYHCDETKEDNILHYTPLQQDCASHFTYQLNGEVDGNDNDAKEDIQTLNLNCKRLTSRRLELLLSSLYYDNEILPADLLKKYREEVVKRDDNNNHHEFYFVLADAIGQLL